MMRTDLLSLLKRAQKQLLQVVVLLTLATIGLWGHKNHWSFSPPHALASPNARPLVSDLGAGEALGLPEATTATDSVKDAPRSTSSFGRPAQKATRIVFPSAKTVQDLGIRSAPTERQTVTREISAAAVISYEPSRRAQLSARVPGTVWRIEKQVGETIRAGDVLAIIDALAVGEAKAELLHSIADVQLNEKVHDALQSFGNGIVAAKQILEAETKLRKARVDLFNAQQALISLGLPVDLTQWQNLPEGELQQRVKFLGLPKSIASQLDPVATTASLLPICAPFDGLVIGRDLAMGETVAPTQRHFEIADVSKMWIVVNVREQDTQELELGQPIVFQAGKVTATSTISWMSTAVDEKTRTVEIRGETDNPVMTNSAGESTGQRLLRANMFGVAKIQLRKNPSLVVTTKAVQWDGHAHVVFVPIDARTFEARLVSIGSASGDFTEIREGLSPTDTVVTEGSHILKAELQRLAAAKPP